MDSNEQSSEVVYDSASLIHAVQWGDLRFVETAIEKHNLSPDTKDKDDCSILHWAAINNRIDIVKYLVGRHANINPIGGNNKEIPLQWALRCQHCTEVATVLISEGADIVHKSIYGCDSLIVAVQCNQLYGAFILLNAGADVNVVDVNGDTPLLWLLRKFSKNTNHDSVEMLRLLLRFNADVSHRANDGCNALHVLASNMWTDIYWAQLIYMASDFATIEAKNKDNQTPYQVACDHQNNDYIRFSYDAWMHKRVPFFLPVFTTSAVVVSFFVCIRLLHLWGIPAFVPIYFLGETMTQSNIATGASRVPCGMAWGVVLSALLYFIIELRNYYPAWLDVVGVVVFGSIMYSMWRTMNTVPQHLKGNDAGSRGRLVQKIVRCEQIGRRKETQRRLAAEAAKADEEQGGGKGGGAADVVEKEQEGDAAAEKFRLCTTCLIDKSTVSMHCSKCNVCVVSLDHHCPFVCNCVGRGNRRMFVAFCFSAALGTMLFAIFSLFLQHSTYCPDAYDGVVRGFF